jgi:DNA-directed RNA polymerase specialized sigma24 family protein
MAAMEDRRILKALIPFTGGTAMLRVPASTQSGVVRSLLAWPGAGRLEPVQPAIPDQPSPAQYTDQRESAPPERLSVADLCRLAREQTARYRNGLPHDDRFNVEMFRRAVVDRDEHCWQELYDLYADQIQSWCRQAGASLRMDMDEAVVRTWAKFWANYTPRKLAAAGGVAAVLAYLRMCARSVMMDAAREQQRIARGCASLPLDHVSVQHAASTPAPDDGVAADAAAEMLWQVIDRSLRDARERVLVTLTFELGLRPSQIQARRPDLFPTVADVYRITRNILDRLRRAPELRDWRG